MLGSDGGKVTARHLARKAYLYVRQSTMRQVMENTESTRRQYDLKQRAVALGWPVDHVVVIDQDLGLSGASAKDREGFQRLVAEVGMGHAGLVMGLEVSRLARNCADWHRLLEICALSETLILDEDGLYDPAAFNDRLVLGLKGAMSEAELHQLRARLKGGMISKARRGELRLRLPVGFVYDQKGNVVLHPDEEVKSSIRLLFSTFKRTGAAAATVRTFREQKLLFPKLLHTGPAKGDLVWKPLTAGRVFQVLKNPRYSGAYAYGRRRSRHLPDGKFVLDIVAKDEWLTLIPGMHEGYLSFEEHGRIQEVLKGNVRGERKYPPREGPALLQGLVICGKCGGRMSTRYYTYRGETHPAYNCPGLGNTQHEPGCQSVIGTTIDAATSDLLLEMVTPLTLEVALVVQKEIQARLDEADQLRKKHVDRAEYEAELSRRRFMKVDPDNRLVADSLEAEWNEKLRELQASREEYERRRKDDRRVLDQETEEKVRRIAGDFPRVWRHPSTPVREKKRMVRLLIEDVTITKGEELLVQVRFRGGATRTLTVRRPRLPWEDRRVSREVVLEVDGLLEDHTPGEIAAILNEKGYLSGTGKTFDGRRVAVIQRAYRLKTRRTRLLATGLLTLKEVASKLGVCLSTVKIRRAQGRLGLKATRLDDDGRYLYEDPAKNALVASSNLSP